MSKYFNKSVNYFNRLEYERIKSFEDLRKSEEKYWVVFNTCPVPMWIYDINTLKFLLVNEAACSKYGYSKEEFYGMGLNDIRPKSDALKVIEAVKTAKGTKHKVWENCYTHIGKNGEEMAVKIESAEIVVDNQVARLVIATDFTEKLQAEELLLDANSSLQAASDLANLGYWSRDLKTNAIDCSDELYNIFDLVKGPVVPTLDGIKMLFHPEDQVHFTKDYDETFIANEVKEFEFRIVTGKGVEKWILIRLTLHKDSYGMPKVEKGIVQDISKRKNDQIALQYSNERFKLVAKAALEAIIDWDIKTGEVFWGSGFREFFGYEPETSDKNMWFRNIHPEDKKQVSARLSSSLSDPKTEYFHEKYRFLKADGSIAYVEHRGIFIRNASGKAIRAVGAIIDVTELREKMVKIKRQNEQLREIAWVQSHVVRAPLATLMGLTNLLQDNHIHKLDQGELVGDIRVCADKLDGVIRDIVQRTEEIESSGLMAS